MIGLSEKVIEVKDAYVLVVEDNMQNMLLLSRLLDRLKVQRYVWKASGWQMLEVVDELPRIDLVLLDLHLPQEDGFDVLSKIRADSRLTETRVVAVTADTQPETLEKVKMAGFDSFLAKPINPQTFPQQITAILHGQAVWDLGR